MVVRAVGEHKTTDDASYRAYVWGCCNPTITSQEMCPCEVSIVWLMVSIKIALDARESFDLENRTPAKLCIKHPTEACVCLLCCKYILKVTLLHQSWVSLTHSRINTHTQNPDRICCYRCVLHNHTHTPPSHRHRIVHTHTHPLISMLVASGRAT